MNRLRRAERRRRPIARLPGGMACAVACAIALGVAAFSTATLFGGKAHGERDGAKETAPAEGPATAKPRLFAAGGRLVSLPGELKKRYDAAVSPLHDPLWGFRRSGDPAADILQYYVILRTPNSEALFVDQRLQNRELYLVGRVFPRSGILEVNRIEWYRGDGRAAVYYWCEICSIRALDPGPCACCQGDVELREEAGLVKLRGLTPPDGKNTCRRTREIVIT